MESSQERSIVNGPSVWQSRCSCLNDFPKETQILSKLWSRPLCLSLLFSRPLCPTWYILQGGDPQLIQQQAHVEILCGSKARKMPVDSPLPRGDSLLTCLGTVPPTYIFLLLKKRFEVTANPLSGLKIKETLGVLLPLLSALISEEIHPLVENFFQGKSFIYRFYFSRSECDVLYLKRFKGALLKRALFHKWMSDFEVSSWVMILTIPNLWLSVKWSLSLSLLSPWHAFVEGRSPLSGGTPYSWDGLCAAVRRQTRHVMMRTEDILGLDMIRVSSLLGMVFKVQFVLDWIVSQMFLSSFKLTAMLFVLPLSSSSHP